MFTGITESIGKIIFIQNLKKKKRIYIKINNNYINNLNIGDSILINGICTTIIMKKNEGFFINISKETFDKTTGLNKKGKINLEKPLTINKYLGGILVTGHIDSIGKIYYINKKYNFCIIRINKNIDKYLIYKGSITINGVNLTINKIKNKKYFIYIMINIIPYTNKKTTFKFLKKNYKINLEMDIFIKYFYKIFNKKLKIYK